MAIESTAPKTTMQRFLDGVEKVGNMVPHPVVIFLILIGIVIALSAVLGLFGTQVSYERINPETHKIEMASTAIRSLLNAEGIRFIYSSLVPNFMAFTAVGLMIVAMIGAGVAEESGLVTALIRKLVIVSPSCGADLHPLLRRHHRQHRRRCRLPRPDPARRHRLSRRRPPPGGRPGAGLRRRSPAPSQSTC